MSAYKRVIVMRNSLFPKGGWHSKSHSMLSINTTHLSIQHFNSKGCMGKECPVKFLNTSLSCPFISHPSVPKGIYGTVRDVTQSSTFLGSTDTSLFICREYISFPSVWGQPSLHFFKLLYNCSGDLNASHTWSWVLAITQIVKST